MKCFIRLPAVLALLIAASGVQAHDLRISDAWVRAAPPNAPALGAFMTIENTSAAERHLVDARSSLDVERVELHRTMMQDGVMQMVPQRRIRLAPGTTTKLEPGSWHVMLIGPKQVPAEGEIVELTLVFDDGSEQVIAAAVRRGKSMMYGQQQMQRHGHGSDCQQAQQRGHDCARDMTSN